MCNECSICYDDDAKCKLVCGHVFHHECIKNWYIKGDNKTCPICRHDIYFRGIRKRRHRWEEQGNEDKIGEIFTKYIMEITKNTNEEIRNVQTMFQDSEIRESIVEFIQENHQRELRLLEKDIKKIKMITQNPEEVEYLLGNMDITYEQLSGPPVYYEPTMKRKPPKLIKNQKKMKGYHKYI